MTRILVERIIEDDKVYIEAACLSTDESKPSGNFVTGSKLVEADTGAEFMYDETAGQWNQTAAGYTAPEETPASDG